MSEQHDSAGTYRSLPTRASVCKKPRPSGAPHRPAGEAFLALLGTFAALDGDGELVEVLKRAHERIHQ